MKGPQHNDANFDVVVKILRYAAQTTFQNNNRVKAQGFVSRRAAFRFSDEFRIGNTNLKDQLRFGSPPKVDRAPVTGATDEDPILTSG
ncbi:hypothetical protein KIN20_029791 [Parelaphostrongylus tenuis]|uniref:Uncharacterized protein n=1 Tax=Parelaphostrongylus tenuis TaxID=148309 RepID=A0AAD5R2Z3_PARTN|nr:hypothetical protein KIN20_029791 [Parelaphostrongylus tenuis]